MEKIRIATRASKLALAQSNQICKLISRIAPDIDVVLIEIFTKGDKDQSDLLYKTGSVGFFTSEVEQVLIEGTADLAVHSFKDLPTAMSPELAIAAVPKREQVADALVTSKGVSTIQDLPAGSSIGTSSLRRIAQIKQIRNDLDCRPLRGNVETRVGKVESGELDAIIVAAAGLNRLGLKDRISGILPPQDFLPAPAQGALAVQIRRGENELMEIVGQLDDRNSRISAQAERTILSEMGGGCSLPLGTYTQIDSGEISIDAVIMDEQGTKSIKRSITGKLEHADQTARALTQAILEAGGDRILEEIHKDRD